VANYLRLLKLPAEIQIGIKEKRIDMGHARAILGSASTEQQLALYHRILKEGLSVRRVEELVTENKQQKRVISKVTKESPYQVQQRQLEQRLGAKVKITDHHLTIIFDDEQQLFQLISRIR